MFSFENPIGYILLLLGLLVTGGFSSFVAGEKGYSTRVWFWLGFFFSFAALIAATGLPNIRGLSKRMD